MSVLNFGQPDFTEAGPWDSGQIDWYHNATITGTLTSPMLNVSQWQGSYLWNRIFTASVFIQITFTWWSDVNQTHLMGGREFTYDSGVANAFEVNLRHLGPWLQLTLVPQTGGTQWHNESHLMHNNRQTPFPTMPDGVFNGPQTFNIAAGGSQTILQVQNLTGRFAAYVNGGNQGVIVSWQFLDYLFAYTEFNKYTVAANTTDYREMIGPNASTTLVLTNVSGASICTGAGYVVILAGPPG